VGRNPKVSGKILEKATVKKEIKVLEAIKANDFNLDHLF
jgi:hypothetical protein